MVYVSKMLIDDTERRFWEFRDVVAGAIYLSAQSTTACVSPR